MNVASSLPLPKVLVIFLYCVFLQCNPQLYNPLQNPSYSILFFFTVQSSSMCALGSTFHWISLLCECAKVCNIKELDNL